MVWIITNKMRMHNLRHELARRLWEARKRPVDTVEVSDNLRELVALCPDEIIERANRLMHDVRNQINNLHMISQFEDKSQVAGIRVHALKMREFKN